MKTFAEKRWGDCSKAVAYCLNFVQMCYYDNMKEEKYFDICNKCYSKKQIADLEYPKAQYSKKDYYVLDICEYGVSKKLRDDMINFGIDENVFRPIHYSVEQKTILGYQICPTVELPSLTEENGLRLVNSCPVCGAKKYEPCNDIDCLSVYNRMGYPDFFNDYALKILNKYHIASSYEYKNSNVYISIELYNYLLKRYPKIECRPVFLGSVRECDEYKRVHDTSCEITPEMTSYTLLEHISKNGDKKSLGIFKTDKIPNEIKKYSKWEGFSEKGSKFIADKICFFDDKIQNQVSTLYIWNKMDIDECCYDDYEPIYYDIFRNDAIAKEAIAKFLTENNLDISNIHYEINEFIIGINYWEGGFSTCYYD